MTRTLPRSADADIADYPMARGCPFDPAPGLDRITDAGGIARVRLWDGSTPWLVTGYDASRAVLADPGISADTGHDGYPHVSAATAARRVRARSFISMDDPQHAQQRRMLTSHFMVKKVERMRPHIQQLVDQLIDDLLAGPNPADLVEAFALPLPSMVICELLGVPYADRDFFHRISRTIIARDTTAQEGLAAVEEMLEYLGGLIEHKLAEPGDDVLSHLAVEQFGPGHLSREQVASMGQLLLVAGHETTANMIGLGTAALLEHPDQLAALRDTDDPAFVAGAVEELLRYLTITHAGRRRVATEDIELGGTTIRAGEGVIVAAEAANRDAAAFPDPDRLDLRRPARHHVAFGYGVHQCLGQPLARVELQVVYSTLYRRIPTLRLAEPVERLPFKHDMLVYGVHELPVTW